MVYNQSVCCYLIVLQTNYSYSISCLTSAEGNLSIHDIALSNCAAKLNNNASLPNLLPNITPIGSPFGATYRGIEIAGFPDTL